jgi:hypothetical protein
MWAPELALKDSPGQMANTLSTVPAKVYGTCFSGILIAVHLSKRKFCFLKQRH